MTDSENTPTAPRVTVEQAGSSITVPAGLGQLVTLVPPPLVIRIIGRNGTEMVAIHVDEGRIEYGPDYHPDEAARLFWDAIRRMAPGPKAQRKVERLDQMATAWLERLPDTIRTATAAEAIHQVTREDQHVTGQPTASDPRQAAYDAVFAYIRQQSRDFVPATVVDRNAMIWRAVHAALDAMGVPSADPQPKEEG